MIGHKARGENTNKIPATSENPGYPSDQTGLKLKKIKLISQHWNEIDR